MTEHMRNENRKAPLYPRTGGLTTSHPKQHTTLLRPDGTAFYNDKELELCLRCCSGHSRPVELESMGRPLYTEKQVYQQQEPDYDLPRHQHFTSASIPQDSTSNTRMTAPLSRNMGCEDERLTPWSRIERSDRSARSRSMLLTTTRYIAFWSRE